MRKFWRSVEKRARHAAGPAPRVELSDVVEGLAELVDTDEARAVLAAGAYLLEQLRAERDDAPGPLGVTGASSGAHR